jgi:hypothetical protein
MKKYAKLKYLFCILFICAFHIVAFRHRPRNNVCNKSFNLLIRVNLCNSCNSWTTGLFSVHELHELTRKGGELRSFLGCFFDTFYH